MKFSIPQKYRLGTLLYNKKFAVVVSVVLAFVIWLGIAMNENPIREQTFTNITAVVSIDNAAAGEGALGVVSDVAAQKFTVTVTGSNYVVSSLRAEDISLYISTVDVDKPGTYDLAVKSINDSNESGYNISISPSTISVTFDYIDSKEFTLVPKLIGVSAAEGLVAETPVVSDSQQSTVTVKGPRSTIEKIASVGTLAEVNDTLSTSQTYSSDVVLYDSNDNILYRYTSDGTVYDASNNIITNSYVTLSFTNVKVTQPISKKKTVNCKAEFTNLPAGMTADDVKYKLSLNKVTIIGIPEIVDNIESISLSAIDFRMVSSTENAEANIGNVFEVSPILPDGVKLFDSIDYFTVTIDVSNYAEKTMEIKNIRCTGLAEGLKAKTDTKIRNVKICGPANIIENIEASDLFAVVDLTDKSAGDYTVEVVIKSDVHKNVWQVGTYSTSITLS